MSRVKRANCHVKSVIEEKFKQWRAGLHPVLWSPNRGEKVKQTAIPRVLRQASIQYPQVSDSIVQIRVVDVAQRA